MTLLEDVESGCFIFLFGTIGGSIFYFVNGTLRSSSRGCRLAGGIQAVVKNGARVRRCAAWAGVVTAISLGVEDALHVTGRVSLPVACGAANALFSMHRGTTAAVRSGLKGAAYGGVAGIAIHGLQDLLYSGESSA